MSNKQQITFIEPPWVMHPNFGPADFFWRDAGQPWMDYVWRPYWSKLDENEKSAYLRRWPAPDVWLQFSTDLNPDFRALLEAADE